MKSRPSTKRAKSKRAPVVPKRIEQVDYFLGWEKVGEDEKLCRDIARFICHTTAVIPRFEMIPVDMVLFAQEMEYDLQHLLSCNDKADVSLDPRADFTEALFYMSYFGNALSKLATHHMTIRRIQTKFKYPRGSTCEDGKLMSGCELLGGSVIERLACKGSGSDKELTIQYYVGLNPDIVPFRDKL
jgi:hypothetical protein